MYKSLSTTKVGAFRTWKRHQTNTKISGDSTMKISIIGFSALCAFASVAQAQTSVTVYGSYDAGLRNLTNVDRAGNNKLAISSTGTYDSNRLGFRGTEDLGGGTSVHFDLETGFNSGTGALDNTANLLFNRYSFVGVTGKYGTVDLGRKFTVAHDVIYGYDPFNLKFLSITLAGPSTSSAGARNSNDIMYIGNFGGLTARAEYSLGEQAGSATNGSTEAVGLSYAQGPISFGGAYTKKKTSVVANTAPYLDYDHYTVGGAYTFGPFRATVGYVNEDQKTVGSVGDTTNKYAWGGLNYTVSSNIALTTAYYTLKNTTAGVNGKKNVAMLGAVYYLSKTFYFYGEIDNTSYKDGYVTNLALNPNGHSSQNGISLGMVKWF
jgi:predicted porin